MGIDLLNLDMVGQLDVLERLARLEKMIRQDPQTGDIIIDNGKAKAILKSNGEIRFQGAKIVQTASENIAFNAAYIDIN